MYKHILFCASLLFTSMVGAQNIDKPIGQLLTGEIIGTEYSVDYSTGQPSTTVYTKDLCFDGDFNTYFASYDRSLTWVGLDLGEPHIITTVAWGSRTGWGKRVKLGLFEGANSPDFSDALPLYIIPEDGKDNTMLYAKVDCSRGFRYVRYVGPHDVRCNVAELAFYGEKGDGDDSHLSQLTNLPTVTVNIVDNQEVQAKEVQLNCTIKIVSDDGTKLLIEEGTIRGRGNASWGFPKKPYRIKFNEKHHVLNSPAKAKKWTLINNYGDKSLMRNLVAFEISRRMGMEYTPFAAAVDLVVNGEYRGCYQLCDQVNINKNRLNITEMEPTDDEGDALTGGYFIEVDAYASGEPSWFNSRYGIPVTIKSPEAELITTNQYNYIKNYFQDFETSIFQHNYTNETSGYRRYLDLDSFLRLFMTGETAGNTDTFWSTFMTKGRGEQRFNVGPVWDFDLAFNNDNRTYPVNNHDEFVVFYYTGSYAGNMFNLVRRIVKNDEAAIERMSQLWSFARDTGLTAEGMTEYIDKLEEEITPSANLNFKRWDILNQYVHMNPQVSGSYAGEVEVVRDFMRNRFDVLDELIGYEPGTGVENKGESESKSMGVVFSLSDELVIYGFPLGTIYNIYNAAGQLIVKGHTSSNAQSVPLPSGIYIVMAGGHTCKVTI